MWVDYDGTTDVMDVFLADWTGPGPAASPEAALGAEAVPEPSAMLLCAFATLGLGFYRRRRRSSSLPPRPLQGREGELF